METDSLEIVGLKQVFGLIFSMERLVTSGLHYTNTTNLREQAVFLGSGSI